MKIKTICRKLNGDALPVFDNEVNAAMAEGWRLVKREVLHGADLGRVYFEPHLYAELVQLDPEPEPQPLDLIETLHTIQDACLGVSVQDCQTGRCPLYEWCHQLRDGGDPTDWILPKKEAPEE